MNAYDPTGAVRTGVLLPPSPEVRLIPAAVGSTADREWGFDLPERGAWRVTGAAGTGVSSLLIDTVIARIEAGADPSGILVVAPSKESGALLRREIARRLEDYAAASTMVRSVHSLAFALLRGGMDDELRLITGAEQDAVIRELLAGHVDAGGVDWPESVRPALGMVGFARQLRDFMLRAHERGLSPARLEELGTQWRRPMWAAAGRFMHEYEEVMALSGRKSLSAAELVAIVAEQPQLTAEHRWHTVIVDDAQLLDPLSGAMVTELARSAELAVVGGDPDQAVFAFRGANEEFLDDFATALPTVHELVLDEPRRRPAPACIAIADSRATQRYVVADAVRRRHLEDGVAWGDIAVIVRGGGEIGQVRRTLLAAGVPVHISPTDVVLSEQRLVSAVLQAVRALTDPLDNVGLEELITGPVGGADPVTLRRLIRGLRRWRPTVRGIDSLREVLDGELPDFGGLLTGREQAILERVRGVLDAGRAALDGSIEDVLWAVWSATGLSDRLQAAALRGGATGSQADRDLDAMMALFDAAGDYAERYPHAPLESFLISIEEQELPTGVRDRRSATPQAVEVLSAHGAVGREWDTVVVIGAQEGTWPSLGETGSLFGQEDLIDYLDEGIEPDVPVSHLAARLQEERRLFHVATSRHRARLLIAAIDAPEGDAVFEPSRFIAEFAGQGLDLPGRLARREANERLRRTAVARELGLNVPDAPGAGMAVGVDLPRLVLKGGAGEEPGELNPLVTSVLSVPSFVSHLRRIVCDPEAEETQREQATRQLARLAHAGVPGADPAQWWGARAVASEGELRIPPTVSPSRVESLLACPLNAVLGNVGEEEGTPMALLRGSMAHAFLEALGRGVNAAEAAELTRGAFAEILDVPAWKRDFELAQFDRLLERTRAWVAQTRGAFELVGVEVPVHVTVAEGVTIHGYIDRLERDHADNPAYYVADLKTGKHAVTGPEAQDHAQLATYQLALAHGTLTERNGEVRVADGKGLERGGGVLFYPASEAKDVTVREQAAWAPEELQAFADYLPGLVQEMRGPQVTARINPTCDSCQVRTLCPVRPEGRMVTDVD
ncbi:MULTISPECIES: ATP-dependent DNA helicase [unclassified Corynebacterium]|uniref:ATP-dependent helicase n=1 Tax=unclassified Corynebacterium TaxID=2624378 RepID=UPI000796D0D7|nr:MULTISPECIES: ATP-dependent DNA helicase [unclassified Corynebacterium]KXB56611.1 UvrD/REP helicase [Corynebacterium sp. DNF00584]